MRSALLVAAFGFALCAAGKEYRIEADFGAEVPPRRAMRDINFPCDLTRSAGLEFDFKVGRRSEFSLFSFHYKCDGKWLSAGFGPGRCEDWTHCLVKKPETKKGEVDWSHVTAFRVSGWRGGTNSTYMAVRDVKIAPPPRKETPEERERRLAAAAESNRVALAAFKATPVPKGERRFSWSHSAVGIKDRGWDRSVEMLKKGGFTDLIANLTRGPRAAYRSDVLAMADVAEGKDRLEECLAACRRHGIRLHIWNCCWRTGWGTTKEELAKFAAEGRVQRSNEGHAKTEWLCPSHPANRQMLVDAMLELARKGVDGVHFDYIRYPDGSYCFCDGCRERFEARVGEKVPQWPGSVLKDVGWKKKWLKFRQDTITSPVREVAERIHGGGMRTEVSAAVFCWPLADPDSVGQDWAMWCEKGYLDFVCPMTYSKTLESFMSAQRQHAEQVTPKVPRYPGIGLSVWPKDGLDIARFTDQVRFLRSERPRGVNGFTVFDLTKRLSDLVDSIQ